MLPPTAPSPFNMPGEERHVAEQEKLREKKVEMERQLAEQAKFKAQPNFSKMWDISVGFSKTIAFLTLISASEFPHLFLSGPESP